MSPLRIILFHKGSDGLLCLNKVLEPAMPDAFSLYGADDPLGYGISLGITHVSEGKIESQPLCLVHEEVGRILASVVKLQLNAGNDTLLERTEAVDSRHLYGIKDGPGCPCSTISRS